MVRKIWKYPLEIDNKTELNMPEGAKILTVQMQGVTPCLWALVDSERRKVPRVFLTYGTGHIIDWINGLEYIGTYQLAGVPQPWGEPPQATRVWHVFELRSSDARLDI